MILRPSFNCTGFVAFVPFFRGESGTAIAVSFSGELNERYPDPACRPRRSMSLASKPSYLESTKKTED